MKQAPEEESHCFLRRGRSWRILHGCTTYGAPSQATTPATSASESSTTDISGVRFVFQSIVNRFLAQCAPLFSFLTERLIA
jgi:hypothetical protein